MATLTIRNLPEEVRDHLRREAAANRRSMEEEARVALAERYGRRLLSVGEANRRLRELNACSPSREGRKLDHTEAFIAAKRIELLFEEGLIPLAERLAWDEKIDRGEVSLDEVEGLFRRLWPWTPQQR